MMDENKSKVHKWSGGGRTLASVGARVYIVQ